MKRLALLLSLLAPAAHAQENESRAFAGGTLTISENADGEKVLAFDGRELARGYFLMFDQQARVEDKDVLLYSAGDGGNACGPASVIVWQPEGQAVKADITGEDCGAPTPSVNASEIIYVPYVGPGEAVDMQSWSPSRGFRLAGIVHFAPQPGTGWAGLAASPVGHPVDYFSNEAFYQQAKKLLGGELATVAGAMSVASEPEKISDGFYASRGCVPHACTVSDGFVAVDVKAGAMWFSQMRDGGFAFWPPLAKWPKKAADAHKAAFADLQ